MSDPHFEPRGWLAVPYQFGREAVPRHTWHEARDRKAAIHKNAAIWQHAHCWAIRDGIKSHFDGSMTYYASEAQCPYDRLAKILRGEHLMKSEDFGLAIALIPGFRERATEILAATLPTSLNRASAIRRGAPTIRSDHFYRG